jgi:uncharacterized protein DUF4157
MRMAVQRDAPVSASPAARPPIQMKTRIGPVDDPLEREADRVADAVTSDRPVGTISGAPIAAVQRKCAACAADEEKTLRRKPEGGSAAASIEAASTARAATAVSGSGMPLSPRERAYFEPRFGQDLSGIRLHTHGAAAGAAAAIDARAYTWGRDIAFARGEYRPDTEAGLHLIAHELAHTLQQEATPLVRRATYGVGASPPWTNATGAVVPQNERPQVDEAMAIIDDVVARSGAFSACHDLFAEHCPGGTSGSLASVWRNATIWRLTTPGLTANGKGKVNGSDIAYSAAGYDQGTEGLAGTLLHEVGHNCGITGTEHWRAAAIKNYCINPQRNEISGSIGGYLGGEDAILMLSYRRFLGDLAYGRLRFTLGADLNLVGSAREAGSIAPENERQPGEFASAMGGFQLRLGGWGGSRFGGLALRAETGIGVGRFAIRPASPDEAPSTGIEAGWVVQIGPRAEFLIRSDSAHVRSFSVAAVYRMVEPLNGDARALHALMATFEYRR